MSIKKGKLIYNNGITLIFYAKENKSVYKIFGPEIQGAKKEYEIPLKFIDADILTGGSNNFHMAGLTNSNGLSVEYCQMDYEGNVLLRKTIDAVYSLTEVVLTRFEKRLWITWENHGKIIGVKSDDEGQTWSPVMTFILNDEDNTLFSVKTPGREFKAYGRNFNGNPQLVVGQNLLDLMPKTSSNREAKAMEKERDFNKPDGSESEIAAFARENASAFMDKFDPSSVVNDAEDTHSIDINNHEQIEAEKKRIKKQLEEMEKAKAEMEAAQPINSPSPKTHEPISVPRTAYEQGEKIISLLEAILSKLTKFTPKKRAIVQKSKHIIKKNGKNIY